MAAAPVQGRETYDPDRVAWSRLELEASKFFVTARSEVELASHPKAVAASELIEPEAKWGIQRLFMERRDGRWIVTLWRDELGPAPAVSSVQRTSSATDLELDLDGHAHVPDWLGIVIEGIER